MTCASVHFHQSSLCDQWKAIKDPWFLHADSEDWADANGGSRGGVSLFEHPPPHPLSPNYFISMGKFWKK